MRDLVVVFLAIAVCFLVGIVRLQRLRRRQVEEETKRLCAEIDVLRQGVEQLAEQLRR